MAAAWESAPLVESEKKRAAWEDAPIVDESESDGLTSYQKAARKDGEGAIGKAVGAIKDFGMDFLSSGGLGIGGMLATQEGRQNLGNASAGTVRGAGSIGATILYPLDKAQDLSSGDRGPSITGLVTGKQPMSRNEERRAAMDAGLKSLGADPNSLAYQVGKVGGEIAGTAGVGPALGIGAKAIGASPAIVNALATGGMRAGATPGVRNMLTRMLFGGITGGAAAGMINPEYAPTGAGIGAFLPPALALAGGFGGAIKNSLSIGDNNRALARTAIQDYGIPLGVGDVAEGGTVKAVRSILNDAPFSGSVGAAQREGVQEGFNKAVGGSFGAPEAKLTPQVMDAAKKRMGAEFDRIWGQNSLNVDAPMVGKLMALQQQAAKLPKNEGASLNAEINDLLNKMVPDSAGGMTIPGDVANKFQSYLRRRAEGSSGLKNELGDLRKEIISAFNRGVSPEDAASLTLNRSQYKAFKTVEPLLNSAEVGVAGRMPGDVPAALLPQAVARQYSQAGGTPLADLAQIGSRFLVDRTPRTGGSMRAALQNTALGTALVGGGLSNPMLAASAIPAAAGTNALLGSPALARYLLRDTQPNALMRLATSPETLQLGYRAAPVAGSR